MEKLIEFLKEGKRNIEDLMFLNMKKVKIFKPSPYMKNGLEVFEIEKEISVDDKIKIVDMFKNNVATYMLEIINKWIVEKNSLPKDRWDNIKTISFKAWIKRNDPQKKIDVDFKVGQYYLFGSRFLINNNTECPTTEYGYSMEYTGEHIANQWFHDLCVVWYKEELKWHKENDLLQIKINKVKKLSNSYGTVFNCKLLNDLVYNNEKDINEEQLDLFISTYKSLEKFIADQAYVISKALGKDAMYRDND